MQLASSLLYGGSLMEASKGSTYDDYKRLLLVCPHCKSPVFLVNPQEGRSPHQRKRGDKVIEVKGSKPIDAYWAHFSGVDPEECEKKSRNFGRKDRERIETNARNQRLKVFQRHFWRLLTNYASSPEIFTSTERCRGLLVEMLQLFSANELKDTNVDPFSPQEAIDFIENALTDFADTFQDVVKRQKDWVWGTIRSESLKEVLEVHQVVGQKKRSTHSFGIEVELHQQITMEAVEFLASPRSLQLLKDFLAVVFYFRLNRACHSAKEGNLTEKEETAIRAFAILSGVKGKKFEEKRYLQACEDIEQQVIFYLVIFVGLTRWGEALHEAQSTQLNSKAS